MKKIILAAVALISINANAQRFVTENRQVSFGYGLNTNIMADDQYNSEWGSNVFMYSVSNFKKFGNSFALMSTAGISWFNFKMKDDSLTLLHDTQFGDKRKLRATRLNYQLGAHLGLGKEQVFVLQASFYVSYGIANSYRRWDTVGDRVYKTSTKDIKYLNPWDYGVKVNIGHRNLQLFANYRMSELFRKNSGFVNMAPLSIGIEITSLKGTSVK